jgi:branched-chain amino acid transport system permease protein
MISVRDYGPMGVLMAALALLPLFNLPNTTINFLVTTLLITLTAQGWNILAGYCGQYSFGHAAFFGTAAYTTAVLQTRYGVNAWLAFGAAIGLAAIVGLSIGALAFRAGLKGSYFALVTLAFAEVFRILANAWSVTGGAAGLLVTLRADAGNFQFSSRLTFYWIALGLVGAVMILTRQLERRRLGAYMIAVRENEPAAQALGVDTLAAKLAAITVSAAITGVAGGLYVQYFLFIDSTIAFGAHVSVEALVAPIVGGLGTVFGPVIGALALHGIGELSKLVAGQIPGIDLVIYGAVLILTVAFAPGGLVGLAHRLNSALRLWRRQP